MAVVRNLRAATPAGWRIQAATVAAMLLIIPTPLLAAPPDGIDAAICTRIASGPLAIVEEADRAAVTAFYSDRNCKPVWIGEQGITPPAGLAIAEMRRAGEWGMKASDFPLVMLDQPMRDGQWSSDRAADAELEITASVLRYAHQAQGGRIPDPENQLSSYIDRQPVLTDAGDVLAQVAAAADPGSALRAFQPASEQFLKLKDVLAALRGSEADLPPPQIARRGAMLQRGSKSPDVEILKRRFAIASEPGQEQLFDAPLVTAVKKFQETASLRADGIVGPSTRLALAGDAPEKTEDKIAAVIANMEEWRWMPRAMGDAYVFVNIPSFSIRLMKNGATIFDDRVVVGTAGTQTPIFSKDMKTIVLRPEWNLPDSIKLTALLSGRSIERQGYVVMRNGHTVDSTRVNWAKANLSEYTFYQPSGDDNALGLVKFLFPNKHSVYLHDTPSRHLFNERVRLFSHGCMRVRNPQKFAQDLFDIDRGSAAPDVKALIRKGPRDNDIALETPIPVHVGYFTVWVDDDGRPQYFPDVYGHQKRITLALAGKWKQIDVGRDHLAAVDTSLLKQVRLRGEARSKKSRRDNFGAPMGATRSFGGPRYAGDSVGDMIRKVLGF